MLNKIRKNNNKRVGRGIGSGKGGHTVGKGQKGQKTRDSVKILFEGVKVKKSFLKRTPFLRGKDKFKPKTKLEIVQTGSLNKYKDGEKVVFAERVKILSNGKLTKKLFIKNASVSNAAKQEIEKLGGNIS